MLTISMRQRDELILQLITAQLETITPAERVFDHECGTGA